jgi:pimeloyl-ACP methyl ester carboxylesterase
MPALAITGGARLHFEVAGSGPPVLLVHGGTGTGTHDWEFQRERLARRHEIVVPDLRAMVAPAIRRGC